MRMVKMTFRYWTYQLDAATIGDMTNKPTTLIQSMRDDLRERRAVRAEYRALKSALATYNSPAEIDDLLLMAEGEGDDAAVLRTILSTNMHRYHVAHSGGKPGLPGMRLSA